MRVSRKDGKNFPLIMLRPQNAQDVLELVRQSGLVSPPTLNQLSVQLSEIETPENTLGLLVAHGLLTRHQASELLSGQWRTLWLGGYKVLDRLGKGGMSHVFLGEHAVLGKRAALKVLSANLRADKVARRRFVREARAASAIEHPNIVHVFDVDMDHDPPYLVMEYVDGISLQAAVAGYGSFTGYETAAVGVEVARGLAVAADAGLVHRDIKPANLLLDRRGGVKILDLGIVRLLGDETNPPANESEEILGTLDYLAPEQAQNSSGVDARADLYALGATLYFLLAGHPPFPGSNLRHKLVAKQYTDPPPIHRLRPDVDPALSSVIHTLLARDPAARFQTATLAKESLAAFSSLPADFPMRFFRPLGGSTITDGIEGPRGSSYAPATESIRKPAQGSHAEIPRGSVEEVGLPTTRLSKALTDMVMTPLPETNPATPPEPMNQRPQRLTHRQAVIKTFWFVVWVLLMCAVIVIIASIW